MNEFLATILLGILIGLWIHTRERGGFKKLDKEIKELHRLIAKFDDETIKKLCDLLKKKKSTNQ